MRSTFCTGFLLCIIISSVFSEEKCLKYRLSSVNYIYVNETKESTSKNLMKINFDILMKPYRGLNYMYTLDFQNLEIFIDRQDKASLDFSKCPSILATDLNFFNPVLVEYDINGLLKQIKVDKIESGVGVNIKFFVASILQINLNTLKQKKYPIKSNEDELTYVGKCPMTYDVVKDHDNKGEIVRLVKTYNLNECSDLKIKSAEKSMIPHGNSASSTHLFRIEGGRVITQMILFREALSNAGNSLADTIEIKLVLKDVQNCDVVPNFINTVNHVSVKKLIEKPIPKEPLETKLNDDLKNIYMALKKSGAAVSIVFDLYEKALKCWD